MSLLRHAERSEANFARNIGFFFLSFVNTACITVFPQHFFAAAQYESRALWLSVTLLAGALCSAAGVYTAARLGLGHRPVLAAMASCAALAFMTLAVAAGGIVDPVLFVLSQCVLCVGTGYLSQALDEHSVRAAGAHGRTGNDTAITAFRFSGMLGAPLLFGLALPGTAAAVLLVAVAAVCGIVGIWQLTRGSRVANVPVRARAAVDAGSTHGSLELIAIVIYACYYVLASSVVVLLGDIQGLGDALTRGPRLIAIVYAAAFLGTVIISICGNRARLIWMLPAPLALLLTVLCVEQEPGAVWSVQVGVCVVLGLCFALFLLAYRNHVSGSAMSNDSPSHIAVFNRLPIVAALVAFAVMLAGAGLAQLLQQQFAYMIVGLLALASLLATAGVLKVAGLFRPAVPTPQ